MATATFSERLEEAMRIRRIKSSQIEKISEQLFNEGKIKKIIKMPLITDYLKGRYEAKQSNIYALALILNVDEALLMGADVPMERQVDKNIQGMEKKSEYGATVLVYGSIPAGMPIELIEDIVDTEEIPADMLNGGKQYIGLKVKGDSMYPEYLDGDTLIILVQPDCENGDDCIVMVNGNEGTFKRVFKNENGVILQPLNNKYSPMPYTNEQIEQLPVRILGVVEEIRRKKRRK